MPPQLFFFWGGGGRGGDIPVRTMLAAAPASSGSSPRARPHVPAQHPTFCDDSAVMVPPSSIGSLASTPTA